jgi:hypothetical protein
MTIVTDTHNQSGELATGRTVLLGHMEPHPLIDIPTAADIVTTLQLEGYIFVNSQYPNVPIENNLAIKFIRNLKLQMGRSNEDEDATGFIPNHRRLSRGRGL